MNEKTLSIVTTLGIIFSIIEMLIVVFKYTKGNMDKKQFIPYLASGILILTSSVISKIIL